MAYSKLTNYISLSPNYSRRYKKISKITIHHMAGNLTVQACGNVFKSPSRQASANYGIGSNGKIGLYVDEKNRAWTSSSESNDQQAVTIEVANCTGAPTWKISSKAMSSLIKLCIDICKRNGIKRLTYNGKPTGTLTLHNMFAATNCPGPYIKKNLSYICSKVNAGLGINTATKRRKVTIKRIYKSSTSKIGKKPVYTTVYISKYVRGARNPYLVVNSKGQALGWVRGVYK